MQFWELLKEQLESNGFLLVQQKENWYWKAENPILYLLCLWDGRSEAEEAEQFAAFGKEMEQKAAYLHCTKVIALSVVIDPQGVDNSVDFVDNSSCPPAYDTQFFRIWWEFSTETGVVKAAAGQPNRLLGIEKRLRAAANGEAVEALPLRKAGEEAKPIVTIGIFGICLFVLLAMFVSGRQNEWMSAYGLSREGILQGEWYRLLSCMFLHSGILHLVSNGIYLYYFGFRSERLLGSGRFLALYLVSGICGGLFSLLFGDGFGVSVGASGAIYGLLGAMLLLTKKRGAMYTGMSYATMLLLAFTAIGLGFFEPNVDNLAHIGGFFGGMAFFAAVLHKKE